MQQRGSETKSWNWRKRKTHRAGIVPQVLLHIGFLIDQGISIAFILDPAPPSFPDKRCQRPASCLSPFLPLLGLSPVLDSWSPFPGGGDWASGGAIGYALAGPFAIDEHQRGY